MSAPWPGGDTPPDGGRAPVRLTPAMSSRKLIALAFIKHYFARWGHSPTLGEVAAELGVSRTRAYDLVHRLATDKMIDIVAGTTRGIRLLERGDELSEGDVLVRLASMGWTIADGDRVILPPIDPAFPPRALTEKGLPGLPYLDHDPVADGAAGAGKGIDGTPGGRAGGGCARAAQAGGRKASG